MDRPEGRRVLKFDRGLWTRPERLEGSEGSEGSEGKVSPDGDEYICRLSAASLPMTGQANTRKAFLWAD